MPLLQLPMTVILQHFHTIAFAETASNQVYPTILKRFLISNAPNMGTSASQLVTELHLAKVLAERTTPAELKTQLGSMPQLQHLACHLQLFLPVLLVGQLASSSRAWAEELQQPNRPVEAAALTAPPRRAVPKPPWILDAAMVSL